MPSALFHSALGVASRAGDEQCAHCRTPKLDHDPLRIFLAKNDPFWFAYCHICEARLWIRLGRIKLAPTPKVGRPTA